MKTFVCYWPLAAAYSDWIRPISGSPLLPSTSHRQGSTARGNYTTDTWTLHCDETIIWPIFYNLQCDQIFSYVTCYFCFVASIKVSFMVKSHISACSWQLGRHSQIPNPKWSNPKSQMVKSQILNGQIPNPKWSNPKRSNLKSLPAVSNWAAISISVLRQKVLHRLGERERLATKFLLIYKSCHVWEIAV